MIGGQPWSVVAFLAFAAFVAGLSRGFSGFGAALIFIPLGSAAVGPALAAPILLAIDAVGAPAYMGGTTLGMWIFGLARPEIFRRISYALIALAAILGLPVVL